VSPVKYELGCNIPSDDILHSHCRENLKSYTDSFVMLYYIPSLLFTNFVFLTSRILCEYEHLALHCVLGILRPHSSTGLAKQGQPRAGIMANSSKKAQMIIGFCRAMLVSSLKVCVVPTVVMLCNSLQLDLIGTTGEYSRILLKWS
jgi:hypothetical protein